MGMADVGGMKRGGGGDIKKGVFLSLLPEIDESAFAL